LLVAPDFTNLAFIMNQKLLLLISQTSAFIMN